MNTKNNRKRLVRIEVSSLCNLGCVMCPQSGSIKTKTNGLISIDLFKKIIEQIPPFLVTDEVHLHIGGEPLLHPHIIDIISFVVSKGLKPILVTNATLLSKNKSQALINSRLHKIAISFEGFDKVSYERLRVGAVYEKTKDNIMKFLEMNPPAGEDGHVLTELRYIDIPYIESSAKSDFHDRHIRLFDTVKKMPYVSWMGKVDRYRGHTRGKYVGCFAPSEALNVLCDGRVVACCYDVLGEMTLGNLTHSPLTHIQGSEILKQLSAKLKTGNIKGLPCEQCELPWKKPKD